MGNKPTIEQRIDKLKPRKGRRQSHWDFIKKRWFRACPEWEEFLLWVYHDRVVRDWDSSFRIGSEHFNFYDNSERFREGIRRVIEHVEQYGSYPDLRVSYWMEEGACCWETCVSCYSERVKGGWFQTMGGTKEQRLAKLAAMIEAARD